MLEKQRNTSFERYVSIESTQTVAVVKQNNNAIVQSETVYRQTTSCILPPQPSETWRIRCPLQLWTGHYYLQLKYNDIKCWILRPVKLSLKTVETESNNPYASSRSRYARSLPFDVTFAP